MKSHLLKRKKAAPKKVGKYICITAFINNWKFLRLFCKDLTFHTSVVEIVFNVWVSKAPFDL